jgi:nitroreductase
MVIDVIRERRSVREYSRKRIGEYELNEILKAGQFAPCGRNLREWEFIVVRKKQMLKRLSKFKKSGANFLANADVGIVVLGDKEKNDLWIEDCSLAAGYMILQATALGIGSCWIQVRGTRHNPYAEEDVRKILNIPKNFGILCIIAFGYPKEKPHPHKDEEFDKNKIHYEKF